jgi:RimJ/RimL family protein N-acetyltransferase
MSRCLKEIVKVGFNYLDVDKILVGHLSTNEASKHVIINCGFKYESQKITEYKDKSGVVLYYSIYKYEFEGGN